MIDSSRLVWPLAMIFVLSLQKRELKYYPTSRLIKRKCFRYVFHFCFDQRWNSKQQTSRPTRFLTSAKFSSVFLSFMFHSSSSRFVCAVDEAHVTQSDRSLLRSNAQRHLIALGGLHLSDVGYFSFFHFQNVTPSRKNQCGTFRMLGCFFFEFCRDFLLFNGRFSVQFLTDCCSQLTVWVLRGHLILWDWVGAGKYSTDRPSHSWEDGQYQQKKRVRQS